MFDFPTSRAEVEFWVPTFRKKALHSKVLAVAKTQIEGRWAAYCFPVPGQNHDDEWHLWQKDGAKMPEEWARPMFPEFDDIPYAS
jgi:hypothetical protein